MDNPLKDLEVGCTLESGATETLQKKNAVLAESVIFTFRPAVHNRMDSSVPNSSVKVVGG
jgi:hypothetical protein